MATKVQMIPTGDFFVVVTFLFASKSGFRHGRSSLSSYLNIWHHRKGTGLVPILAVK